MRRSARALGAPAAVVLAIAILAAGCSRSVDVSSVESSAAKSPAWVTKAYALARAKHASKPSEDAPITTVPPTATTTPSGGLPDRAQFVAAVSSLGGLDATAAGCIYDNINGTPLATTIGNLVASTTDPLKAATATGNIDEATQKQLLVALAPCLDTKTLIGLLGSISGGSALAGLANGGTTNTTLPNLSGVQSLLASVVKQAGSIPSSINAATLAKTAGVNLSPAQIAALTQAIQSAQQLATVVGGSNNIDLSKIDITKLTQPQIVSLFTALIKGLTPAQLAQLNQVAAVDLQSLNLNIDTSKLDKDQLGSLFAILLPFISAGIKSPTGQPPPGGDPSQIYIPPGTDLSAINPLNFIPQATIVNGLVTNYKLSTGVAACLYQKVRLIDPRLLGAAYQGTNLTGAGELLLAVLSCIGA